MRKYRAALTLVVAAPLVAEVFPASAPITRPGLLPFILLVYGPGALLIREIVRRCGRGWPSILLLGSAYGFIEEGLALQSLFNPSLYHASAWGARGFGMNGVYTESAIFIHAIWSAAIPILIVDLVFPDLSASPYLGRISTALTAVWYIVGVFLLALLTRFSIAPGYWAPPALLGAVTAAALALILVALVTPRRNSRQQESPRTAPGPLVVFMIISIAGFIWHSSLALLWRVKPDFAQWPLCLIPMLAAIAILFSTFGLLRRWGKAVNWSNGHRLAVASGATIAHTAIGGMILAHTTMDRVGSSLLTVIFLVFLTMHVGRQARKEGTVPQYSGE